VKEIQGNQIICAPILPDDCFDRLMRCEQQLAELQKWQPLAAAQCDNFLSSAQAFGQQQCDKSFKDSQALHQAQVHAVIANSVADPDAAATLQMEQASEAALKRTKDSMTAKVVDAKKAMTPEMAQEEIKKMLKTIGDTYMSLTADAQREVALHLTEIMALPVWSEMCTECDAAAEVQAHTPSAIGGDHGAASNTHLASQPQQHNQTTPVEAAPSSINAEGTPQSTPTPGVGARGERKSKSNSLAAQPIALTIPPLIAPYSAHSLTNVADTNVDTLIDSVPRNADGNRFLNAVVRAINVHAGKRVISENLSAENKRQPIKAHANHVPRGQFFKWLSDAKEAANLS